jgi:hypothetical protein
LFKNGFECKYYKKSCTKIKKLSRLLVLGTVGVILYISIVFLYHYIPMKKYYFKHTNLNYLYSYSYYIYELLMAILLTFVLFYILFVL